MIVYRDFPVVLKQYYESFMNSTFSFLNLSGNSNVTRYKSYESWAVNENVIWVILPAFWSFIYIFRTYSTHFFHFEYHLLCGLLYWALILTNEHLTKGVGLKHIWTVFLMANKFYLLHYYVIDRKWYSSEMRVSSCTYRKIFLLSFKIM